MEERRCSLRVMVEQVAIPPAFIKNFLDASDPYLVLLKTFVVRRGSKQTFTLSAKISQNGRKTGTCWRKKEAINLAGNSFRPSEGGKKPLTGAESGKNPKKQFCAPMTSEEAPDLQKKKSG